MIAINLIPREYIDKQKRAAWGRLGAIAGAVVVLIVGGFSLVIVSRSRSLIGQVRILEARVKQLEEVAKQVDDLEAKKRSIEAKNAVVTTLLTARLDYPKVMEAVVRSLPPNQMWMTSMSTKKSDNAYAVNIAANAVSVDAVIRWLEKLQNTQGFSGVKLGAISSGAQGASFPMTFSYQPQ
ncbi:MAG: PilN domain-containing protein [Elusimicrobia bacterium]|nr:PilN domain-containing protein [Elusimicrobiota bacterium]